MEHEWSSAVSGKEASLTSCVVSGKSLQLYGPQNAPFIYLFIYLFFVFSGPHLRHMEVPRLGV